MAIAYGSVYVPVLGVLAIAADAKSKSRDS
jgi:hypothetical protein